MFGAFLYVCHMEYSSNQSLEAKLNSSKTHMQKPISPIGVFDSGMGGLTVARALRKHLPHRDLIYFGDTAHLPYGEKSAEAIRSYALAIVGFLREKGCQQVVVACNSASAVAMEVLETSYPDITFYNVVDPVVDFVANLPIQSVGVIGTRATVKSGVYPAKLALKRLDLEVHSLATPLLVPVIEEGFLNTPISHSVIEQYVTDPQLKDVEALVLGCTHYPLAFNEFRQLLPAKIEILNSPEIVATYVKEAVKASEDTRFTDAELAVETSESSDSSSASPAGNSIGKAQFYLSDYSQQFADLATRFYGEPMNWMLQRLEG